MDEASYLKQVLNSGKIGILDWQLTQDTFLISKSLQNMLGYQNNESDMTRYSIATLIPEKDQIEINKTINNLQSEKKTEFSIQHVMIQNDGFHCWVLHNGTISYNQNGEPTRLISSIINITKMKVSEVVLKESEERYRALFESTNEGLLLLDKDHNTILYANETIAQMVNYPIAELIKMKFNEITSEGIEIKLEAIIQLEHSILSNITLRRANNEYIYVDINYIRTTIDEKEYYICLIRDVTERKEYEFSILESKRKYHTYIANAPYGIFIVDSKGNYLEVNEAACKMTGYSELELLLMNIKDILNPETMQQSVSNFKVLLEKGKMDVVENCITKDGKHYKKLIKAVKIDEDKYIGFAQNVTDRMKTEQLLVESEEQFKKIVEQSFDVVIMRDNNGIIQYASPNITKTFGYTDKEVIGKNIKDYFHPTELPKVKQAFHDISEGKLINRLLTKFKNKDGNFVEVEINGTPIYKDNKIVGACGFLNDVTEKNKTLQLLKDSEEQFKKIAEQSFDAIIMIDLEGVINYTSPAITKIFGYGTQELLGKNILDQVPPSDRDKSKTAFQVTGQGKLVKNLLTKFIKKDGVVVEVEVNAAPIYKHGEIIGGCGFLNDVTEQNRTLQKLKDSEDKYKNITERSFDAIYVIDRSLNLEYISPSMTTHFGHKSENVIGKSVLDYVPKNDIETTKLAIEQVFSGVNLEFDKAHIICADGSVSGLEVNVVPVYKNNIIVGAQGMIRDVTERNEAKQKLEQAETKYQNLFESAPVSIWREDFSAIKSHINSLREKGIDNFEKYFDKHPEEVMKCVSLLKVIDINAETVNLLKAKNKEEVFSSLDKVFTINSIKTFKYELLCLIAKKNKFRSETTIKTFEDKTINVMISVSLDYSVDDWSNALISIVDITDLKDTEVALKTSEEKFSTITNQTSEGIAVADLDGNYVFVNPAFCKMSGYSNEELLNLTVFDMKAKDQSHISFSESSDTMQGIPLQVNLMRKDKTEYLTEIVGNKIFIGDEEFVLGTVRDITERKKTEDKLSKEQERAQTYLDIASVMFVAIDTSGKVTLVNQKTCEILGYSEQEIIGKSWFDNFLPERIRMATKHVAKKLLNDEMESVEYYENSVLTKNKTERTIAWHNTILRNKKGKIIGHLSSGEDISNRKQTEEKLKTSEEKYRDLFDESVAAIYLFDAQKNFIDSNQAGLDLLGYSREELLKMSIPDVDAEPSEVVEAHEDLNRGIQLIDFEHQLRRKDGKIITVLNNSKTSFDINGNVATIQSTLLDITERKQSEKALEDSEKKYRNLFEVAQEGILVIDADSHTTMVNQSMAGMLGYSIDEMVGKHLFEFMDETGIEIAKYNIERRKSGIKEQHDFKFLTKDGKHIFTTLETAPIYDDEKNYIGAIAGVINITERKAAENELLASKKQYDQILDRSNAVVYIKDLNHKYLYANAVFYNLFKLTRENLIGKTDYDIFKKEQADMFIANDIKVAAEKKHIRIHEKVLHGENIHTYISDKFPLYDSVGKLYATCGISTDITDLIEAQQKEKNAQQLLVKKDRLINAGQLAAAVAHEINNPLTVLHGSLEEIKESKDDLNDDIIDSMLSVSRRIKKIINSLLIFTHQSDNLKQVMDVNTIIKNTFLLISNILIKSSIEYTLELSDEKLETKVDQVRIQQVFINLIFNAMHAMKKGGKLNIKSYIHQNSIIISFEDNGSGISEENMKSIFLPFFTTKDVGEGTGLGLSISHGIIEEHNGTISVVSQLNTGTTFTIKLPIIKLQ